MLAKSEFSFETLIQAAMVKAKAGKNLAKLQIEFFDLWYSLVNDAKRNGVAPARERPSNNVVWLNDRRKGRGQSNNIS